MVSFERTPDGRRVEVARDIDAPREAVWDVLVDTRRWPEWGPSVAAVECPDRRVTAGTTGRVRVSGLGVWVPFEVETCAGYRWTWSVRPPAGRLAALAPRVPATGHRVEATAGGSRAVFEIPPLAAGYAVVCRRALRNVERLATGE